MPPSRAARRTILLLVLIASARSRAEEAGETIDVRGQRPEGTARAPAAETTTVDVGQFGGEVRTVSELLLTSPGVTVHALGGPGQPATLSLRGASADQSLVLLDGIPLRGPGGGAIDLATLPGTLLQRVVVTRGVLGAQYGAGALGGAVELLPRPARGSLDGGAQISAGSFGSGQLSLDLAGPLGSGSGLVAVQGDRTAGAFDYVRQATPGIAGSPYYGYVRENADASRLSLLARAAQPIFPSAEIDLIAQASAGSRGIPGPANAPTGLPRENDQGGLFGARLQATAGEMAWSLRTWARVDRLELRGVQAFGECQDGAPGCPRIDQRFSTARAEGELSAPLLERHAISAMLSGGGEWIAGAETGGHRRALASLALRDDWRLAEALSVHPALRLEAVGSETGLSPGITAAWTSGPWQARAGFGLSFRPPSFAELYLSTGGLAPNPELRPERAWSADAGLSLHQGPLRVSAGVFWSRYRDLILYELSPSANQVKPFNLGSARVAGAELQAVLQLPAGVLAEIGYSFLDSRNLRPGAQEGHRLSYRPPHRLFARLARHGDRVEGYAESSFTSSMPRNLYDSALLPAQAVFNAGAGVRAAGPLWIDLEVKNLLDDQTLEDLFQYPLPGRSIAVIARARL